MGIKCGCPILPSPDTSLVGFRLKALPNPYRNAINCTVYLGGTGEDVIVRPREDDIAVPAYIHRERAMERK